MNVRAKVQRKQFFVKLMETKKSLDQEAERSRWFVVNQQNNETSTYLKQFNVVFIISVYTFILIVYPFLVVSSKIIIKKLFSLFHHPKESACRDSSL